MSDRFEKSTALQTATVSAVRRRFRILALEARAFDAHLEAELEALRALVPNLPADWYETPAPRPMTQPERLRDAVELLLGGDVGRDGMFALGVVVDELESAARATPYSLRSEWEAETARPVALHRST